MMNCRFLVLVTLMSGVVLGAWGAANAPKKKAGNNQASPERWEATMRKFEEADKANAPAKGGILLVGGSNARRWTDVGDYFPGENVINRGFGGAQLGEVVHFMDRIVIPYAPKVILLNAGGNDLSAGKTPEAVRDACRAFMARVRASLPETRVIQISIPPVMRAASSPDSLAQLRRANQVIAELAREDERWVFIDLFPAFLGADGKPRAELFVQDGTHFSAQGYAIVARLLKEKMKEIGVAGK